VVCGKVPPSQISPAFQARRGVVPEDGGGGWRLTADDPYARFPHVMSRGGASWAGDGGSGAPPRGEGGSWPGAVHGASGAAGPGQRPHPPPRTRRRLRGGAYLPRKVSGSCHPGNLSPLSALPPALPPGGPPPLPSVYPTSQGTLVLRHQFGASPRNPIIYLDIPHLKRIVSGPRRPCGSDTLGGLVSLTELSAADNQLTAVPQDYPGGL